VCILKANTVSFLLMMPGKPRFQLISGFSI
jgi:hypothetical protein